MHPAHPYRIPAAEADRQRPPASRDDDRSLLWLLFVVGAIRVIAEIPRGGAWGAEPTIALMIVLFAGWHLARTCLADAVRRRARRRSAAAPPASRA